MLPACTSRIQYRWVPPSPASDKHRRITALDGLNLGGKLEIYFKICASLSKRAAEMFYVYIENKNNSFPCLDNLCLSEAIIRTISFKEISKSHPELLGPLACLWPLPKLTGLTLTCAITGSGTQTWCSQDRILHQPSTQMFSVSSPSVGLSRIVTLLFRWLKIPGYQQGTHPIKSRLPKCGVSMGAEVCGMHSCGINRDGHSTDQSLN